MRLIIRASPPTLQSPLRETEKHFRSHSSKQTFTHLEVVHGEICQANGSRPDMLHSHPQLLPGDISFFAVMSWNQMMKRQ